MYSKIRPILFNLEPEDAHNKTLRLLQRAGRFPWRSVLPLWFAAPAQPVEAFGLTFPNPVGLAAGYDKNAVAIRGLTTLGFGHIEIGTVTPLAQAGNPSPRVFRLPEDEAVINRMGFPSHGATAVIKRLEKLGYYTDAPGQKATRGISLKRFFPKSRPKKRTSKLILGVNIGKNKSTPHHEAVLDYLSLLELFAPSADYLTINVSSPNTAGLRDLQKQGALEALLTQLDYQRKLEEKKLQKKLPLLVKLSPDLADAQRRDALAVILATGMDGVVATNTTVSRAEGLRSAHRGESGGLSGSPLASASEAALRQIVKQVDGKIPIVSVGGIMSPTDAKRRLEMGATLVQIYTGLIYYGPELARDIVAAL